MSNIPEPRHAPDSPTGVRQGRLGRPVRVVLIVSITLAVIALALSWLAI
ncbi:hypothetical protein ACQW02_03590 [Humitalea sp. 24SJ18S-53]